MGKVYRMTPHLPLLAALVLSAIALPAAEGWLTDLDEARKVAVREKKAILIDFTGSDWCGFCIKLRDEVFTTKEFKDFAKNYVLVELDYPNKKPQPPEVKARNREIQAKFDVRGFPTVLLMDAQSGDAYGRVSGYSPGSGPKDYLARLSAFVNTPEGREKASAEAKAAAEDRKKRAEHTAKINAAIKQKDFEEVCRLYDELHSGRPGIASINKALASQGIDPANKERALKWADQAIREAAGDEKLVNAFKSIRERIQKGPAKAPGAKPTPSSTNSGS